MDGIRSPNHVVRKILMQGSTGSTVLTPYRDLSGVDKCRPLNERKIMLSHSRSYRVVRNDTD